MEVTAAQVARIPGGNIRVSRSEFGAVWAAFELQVDVKVRHGVTDWFAGGVTATCRWLAGAVMSDRIGRRELPFSPATDRCVQAYEELIEAEYLVAERLDLTRPDLAQHRPGWCEGIRTTMRWTWRCIGPPPVADT